MRTLLRRWAVVPGLLVLLLLAGCGNGSTKPSRPALPQSSSPAGGAPPGVAQPPAKLRDIVLGAAEVGPGYADDANVAASFNKVIAEALARCGRADTFLAGANQADRADSSLRRDPTTAAYSMAVSAPSEAEVTSVMDLVGSDDFPMCLSKALEAQAGDPSDGIFIAEMRSTRSVVANRVSQTLSLQNKTVLTFSQPGLSVTAFTDYVFLRQGRTVAEVFTVAKDQPTAPAELQRLVDIVSERLKR